MIAPRQRRLEGRHRDAAAVPIQTAPDATAIEERRAAIRAVRIDDGRRSRRPPVSHRRCTRIAH
jgi:hypothetical protein